MYSNTLQEVRHYLSGAVGDLEYGQCGVTGATTTKIYITTLWQPDDYYNEHKHQVHIYSGTNIGVDRRVTDWVLADKLATVHTAYDAACDASSWAEFHYKFTADDYGKAINLAIISLGDKYYIPMTDETVTGVADQYEYDIPDNFTHISRLTKETSADSGEFTLPNAIEPRIWELISPRKLKFAKPHYSPDAGIDLRLEGSGTQELLVADTDICYLPVDWLIQKAITFLPQGKIQSNELDDTYKQALLFSSREPLAGPDPRAQRVVE